MSPSKDADEQVKLGADLLLKGWTMLNRACPTCYQPLYKKDDRVICVKCKQDYVIVDSPSDIPKSQQKTKKQQSAQDSSNISAAKTDFSSFDFSTLPPALIDTANIMLDKISKLNIRLKETEDPKEISEISNSIRSLVDSLRSLTL